MAIKNLETRPTLFMVFFLSKNLLELGLPDFVIDFSVVYKHKRLFFVIEKTTVIFVPKRQIQSNFDQKSRTNMQRLRDSPNHMLRL